MEIKTSNSPVIVPKGNVVFVLDDRGGAHVKLILSIKGKEPLQHDETFQGSKTTLLVLDVGTYDCGVMIAAFKYGALNRHYDSNITANGISLANAKGDIPQTDASDFGFKRFVLTVK
jgi:hypothetical protein